MARRDPLGQRIAPLEPFPAVRGSCVFLVYPGFGISTAWAYQALAKYPEALNGRPGRAQNLVALLQKGDLNAAAGELYNSLEAPALAKYPLLALFQEFLRTHGAMAALMSGSGSTTFGLVNGQAAAERLREEFNAKFGENFWTAIVPVPGTEP